MKVLIITYYWPPAGGSGVQRWLKFVKYLQSFDIEPVVYTVDNPNYAIVDNSLENDVPRNITVLRQPIWEPNDLLSFFKKKSTKTSAGFLNPNPSFLGKILQYIRANYFIPDARKHWIKPSVKFLSNYLLENKVDAIITTGPPHSMHLIGLQLKQKLELKWISDFRDPWTEIDYFHQLPLTEKSVKKHLELEKEVLENSDAVLVVGKTMKKKFKRFSKNIHVITNGYDIEVNSFKEEKSLDIKFSITHIGLMNADRNPRILWEVLLELIDENKEFKNDIEVKLIGKIAEEVETSLDRLPKEIINRVGYVSHEKVKNYQQKSQVLLLAVNKVPSAKGIITGKIFEYLQAKRPILAIGPKDGDLAEILSETNSGIIVDFKDKNQLKQEIIKLYSKFKNGNLKVNSKNIEQYHRKELTKKLSEVIKELLK
ncbi:MAG: glycosyltransferase family 4 protein [Flavobacteriaceae bacterium]